MPYVSLVKEFKTLERGSAYRLPFVKATNLATNDVPQVVLAKFVVLVNWQNPQVPNPFMRSRGPFKDIFGCPEDQLGTPSAEAPDPIVVQVGLELRLGDVIGRYVSTGGGFCVYDVVGAVHIVLSQKDNNPIALGAVFIERC